MGMPGECRRVQLPGLWPLVQVPGIERLADAMVDYRGYSCRHVLHGSLPGPALSPASYWWEGDVVCYPSPLYVVRDQVALWMFFVDQYEAPLAPRPPTPRCADIVYRGFQAANRVAHDGHTVSPSFRCIASTPS